METSAQGPRRAHRGAALVLLLNALLVAGLPVAEAWHDHAPRDATVHVEGTPCAPVQGQECPLLRTTGAQLPSSTAPSILDAPWQDLLDVRSTYEVALQSDSRPSSLPRAPPTV